MEPHLRNIKLKAVEPTAEHLRKINFSEEEIKKKDFTEDNMIVGSWMNDLNNKH
jgi:hypothetical protein